MTMTSTGAGLTRRIRWRRREPTTGPGCQLPRGATNSLGALFLLVFPLFCIYIMFFSGMKNLLEK
jgi:hypothetical protein